MRFLALCARNDRSFGSINWRGMTSLTNNVETCCRALLYPLKKLSFRAKRGILKNIRFFIVFYENLLFLRFKT